MSEAVADASAAIAEQGRFDVFLSYNRRDEAAVLRLADKLMAARFVPWFDRWHLTPGGDFQDEMAAGLRAATACAVFIGMHGVGDWSRKELGLAEDRDAKDRAFRLFPVLLPGVPDRFEPTALPGFLGLKSWVDFRSGIEDPQAFEDFTCAIAGRLRQREVRSDGVDDRCPYRGLENFEEADADIFFGREPDVQRLLEQLKGARFLAVLGPSGSGKSSLVRAGLVPALRRGQVPESESWATQILRPGGRPLEELAARLVALDPRAGMLRTVDELAGDRRGLHAATAFALTDRSPRSRAVWVIDQFEEIFTLCHDDAARARFLDNLLYAATVPDGRCTVVLTMRADFYPRCASYPELAQQVAASQYLVSPLDEAGLRRAIVEPAHAVGLGFEPGLVETILDEVAARPGALPLLQHALLELWKRRRGSTLSLAAYKESGGVEGALRQSANETFDRLTADQQATARDVLLRLTQPGEGTEDTRRRATLDELVPQGRAEAVEAVIRGLTDARLLTVSRSDTPASGDGPAGSAGARDTGARDASAPAGDRAAETWVELSHEALLRGWPRLKEWIDADREALKVHRRLTDAALEWHRFGRDDGLLYRGVRLAEAQEWRLGHSTAPNDLERQFIDASAALRDRERAERERRRRLITVGALAAAIVSVAVALFTASQWGRAEAAATDAERQRQAGLARQLAAESLNRLDDRDLSLLLSVEANAIAERERLDDPQVTHSLVDSLGASPTLQTFLHGHTAPVRGVAFSPDGALLASGGEDGAVILWDAKGGTHAAQATLAYSAPILSIAFSSDGRTLAAGSKDGSIVLWDVATRQQRGQLTGHRAAVRSVAFDPRDGGRLVSGSNDRTLIVWDVAAGHPIGAPLSGHTDNIRSVAFSPDGTRLASGSDDATVRLWDVEHLQPLGAPLPGPSHDPINDDIVSVAFARDNQTLAAATWDGTIALWDVEQRQMLGEPIDAGPTPLVSVAFSPDGRTLLSGSVGKEVSLWDVANRERIGTPQLVHAGWVNSVAFSPGGLTWASGGGDHAVVLWTGSGRLPLGIVAGRHPTIAIGLVFPGNGTLMASGLDGTVLIWDLATRQPRRRATQRPMGPGVLAIRPDGRLAATGTHDGAIVLTDPLTRRTLGRLITGASSTITSVAFSADGRLLVSAGCAQGNWPACEQGEIRLWDVEGRKQRGPTVSGQSDVRGLVVSPNGRYLAARAADGSIVSWDLMGSEPHSQIVAEAGPGYPLALGPDGKRLAYDHANTIVVSDLSDGHVVFQRPSDPDGLSNLAFSPDGQTLAAGHADGTVSLSDLASGEEQTEKLVTDTVAIAGLAFSPDSRTLAASDLWGNVYLWSLPSGERDGGVLQSYTIPTTSVALSPDGRILASSGFGMGLMLWDLAAQRFLGRFGTTQVGVTSVAFSPDSAVVAVAGATGPGTSTITLQEVADPTVGRVLTQVQDGGVKALAFGDDGRTVVAGECAAPYDSVCSRGAVRIWDAQTGELRGEPILSAPGLGSAVAISRDGRLIAWGGVDGSIEAWDVVADRSVVRLPGGHSQEVFSLAFSPDGALLASGSRDTNVVLWDLERGQQIGQPLVGHTNSVFSVQFSPDGRLLVSAGGDNKIRLWDVASHQPLGSLNGHQDWVSTLSFGQDGKQLASGARDGLTILWNLDPASWPARACAVANRNLTLQEWQQFLGNEPYHKTCPSLPPGPAQ
ncbi:MAG: TIR domain-containing protein [Chloroflexi bacterium]|nr:TIR domain-containing protein [Chloroflexota bacterium]